MLGLSRRNLYRQNLSERAIVGRVGAGGIYLLRGDEELLELRPQPYESESILQALIARFPGLLAGDAGPDAAQRWLLVGREAALPDEEDGGGRWSVDHLFLDQDAVPTLVEVKRASDSRIRREVVGQLLDYAANAVVYWPIERLRELFARECERSGSDPEQLVAEVAAEALDVEAFWQRAAENLRVGRLRLVFVADEMPRELRRVIEFLNGQMSAEVIGIEVKQYVGEGLKTLVPKIVGQTAEAETRKGRAPRASRDWDEQTLFTELAGNCSPNEVAVARALYDWTRAQGWRSTYGTGSIGSWQPVLDVNGRQYAPLSLRTNGSLRIRLGQRHLATRPPFDDDGKRRQFIAQLNQIAGVSLAPEAIEKYPSIDLRTLAADPAALSQLENALDWFKHTASVSASQ
jgi:hypothetical protein